MPATLENQDEAMRQAQWRRLIRHLTASIWGVVLLTAVFAANASTEGLAVMGAIAWGLAVMIQILIGIMVLRSRRLRLRAMPRTE